MRPGIRTALRRGSRTVLGTYPALRVGNYLYFALHAHIRRQAGQDLRVVDSGLGDEWLALFPGLEDLLVPAGAVRFHDRRMHIPRGFLQGFGSDFTRADLAAFVSARLAASPSFRDRLAALPEAPLGTLVVNVRRGDYYADEPFRRVFGFDVAPYLAQAIAAAEDAEPVRRILVVSDDPDWCTRTLAGLGIAPPEGVQARPAGDPVADFVAVAGARRAVITNSTFSYWAAYVGAELHGPGHRVWAPDFHSRDVDAGRPWQHDPRWVTFPVRPSEAAA